MAKKARKVIYMNLKVTAPAGMMARDIRREVLTRINEACQHFDAFGLNLPDSAENEGGVLRVRAAIKRGEQ